MPVSGKMYVFCFRIVLLISLVQKPLPPHALIASPSPCRARLAKFLGEHKETVSHGYAVSPRIHETIASPSPCRARLAKFHSKTGASEYRSSRAMAMVYFSDNPQILYRAQTSAQLHPGHMICPGGTGTTTHLIQSAA